MEQIELFKLNKKFVIALGLAGLILIVVDVVVLFAESIDFNEFLTIGNPALLVFSMVLTYKNFKNYYIHFDKDQIEWNFPGMNNPKSVSLTDQPSEIGKNWKGVIVNYNNKSIDISTDGLWDRDKNLIYKKLKEYYS